MPAGLDNLKHIVVLMMENRSFDHMLGSLKAVDPRIDGVTDQDPYGNPDTTGAIVKPQALAEFQAQLQPDPDHHFPAVDLQIFGGDTSANRTAQHAGLRKELFQPAEGRPAFAENHVLLQAERSAGAHDSGAGVRGLQSLVRFHSWSHDLQPRVRALWDFIRSCGHEPDLSPEPFKSIYSRLINADSEANRQNLLLRYRPAPPWRSRTSCRISRNCSATYSQFLEDCEKGTLPDYSFIEPNYNDHETDSGEQVANDQHPDHNMQAGEAFIASVYQAIKDNRAALAEHGAAHRL